jgi:uncharacterized protein DUF4154
MHPACRFFRPWRRPGRVDLTLTLFLVGWLATVPTYAGSGAPSEYAVKAAFLFNFAKFVDWPPSKFAAENAPLVIGLVGDDVFGDVLDSTIHRKAVNNHPLVLRRLARGGALKDCHILFVSPSEKDHLAEIIAAVKGSAVLTVSETDQFLDNGGTINFWIEGDQVKLEIALGPAEREGLKISSRLLNLPIVKIKDKS